MKIIIHKSFRYFSNFKYGRDTGRLLEFLNLELFLHMKAIARFKY